MALISSTRQYRSLLLALGVTGFVAASGAQAVVVNGLVDEVQVEAFGDALPVEAADVAADQQDAAVLYEMAEPVDAEMATTVGDPAASVDPVIDEQQDVALFSELPADAVAVNDMVAPEPMTLTDVVDSVAIVDPVVDEPQDVALLSELPADMSDQSDAAVSDMVKLVDAPMPDGVLDPVLDETKVIATLMDSADAVSDAAGGSMTDVPIEWVMRDGTPDIMYSMMGSGSIGDTAEEVASRAAEQAANRSLDQIDSTLPENTPAN